MITIQEPGKSPECPSSYLAIGFPPLFVQGGSNPPPTKFGTGVRMISLTN